MPYQFFTALAITIMLAADLQQDGSENESSGSKDDVTGRQSTTVAQDSTAPPIEESQPKEITSAATGMKLVLIPAGEFTMGSSKQDVDRLVADFSPLHFHRSHADADQPQHRVKISEPFYMGKYEVKLKEFLHFYHDAKYKLDCEKEGKGGWGYDATKKEFAQRLNYRPWSWGFAGQTQEHPVVNVSWNDAKAFCDWLSKKDGRKYRLPTEAEWEYACRAGTTTRHPAGDRTKDLVKIANVADQSIKQIPVTWEWVAVDFDDGYPFSAPVGSFAPNDFGLYDMIGNVLEWCEDVYDQNAFAARGTLTTDPWVTSGSVTHVVRGGSWGTMPRTTRAAHRDGALPNFRDCSFGFRVVMVGARTP